MRGVALLLAMALPAAADDLPALFSLTGVPADDVLNVRQSASATAPILATLPPGPGVIEVVALSPDGKWAQVNAGETSGWVARRFLAPVPGKLPWWQMQEPLHCFGTEPFWKLSVSRAAQSGLLLSPDMAPVKLAANGVWPGSMNVPTAGVVLDAEGISVHAVITRAECSDGMSDRAFGLGATLLVGGATIGKSAPLSGCCSLVP